MCGMLSVNGVDGKIESEYMIIDDARRALLPKVYILVYGLDDS